MAAIFIDCPEAMAGLWETVRRPGDPVIAMETCNGQPQDVPALVGGYSTAITDHTYFKADLLGRCPGLRHLIFLGTGAGSFIDLDAAARLGKRVHTIKGYGDTTVAEHTLALALAAAREVAWMDREVRSGGWRKPAGMQLLGKTLGIIGLGGVGKEVARLGRGIGMNVLAWNRSRSDLPTAELDEVLAGADILCLCLALNDETRLFLDAARLRRTKPGVIFVNTARAGLVDNAALVELLRSGHVRHAAMDVFEQEPPEPSDPFLSLPNVTLTAHAGFMTPEATMTMLRRAIDLVIEWDR
jgi:D-3-phosphoglycerate dehydrogenase